MSAKPVLSICVPSRNRQPYFQKTIEALARSLRTDVEFVFADNSDDPSIMNDFMKAGIIDDPRVVYLPGTGQALSMVDNWERTVAASSGQWVSVIGDDDYLDPDLACLLQSVTAATPDLDAFGWRTLGYTWPHPGRLKMGVFVPFDSFVVKILQADAFRRMFGWFEAKHVPTSGFSIYHAAISRHLLEKIKRRYGGTYFEHAVVDYDNAFKVICTGKTFAYTARPFSVMGSCPQSNSFGIGKLKDFKEKIALFISEVATDYETGEHVKDFPFKSVLGTTAAIAQAQQWFKTKYQLKYNDWEVDFAKACAMDVQGYPDEESFNIAREGYESAFRHWKKGKYLRHFKPVYSEKQTAQKYAISSGFREDGVYLDHDIAGNRSPGELFDIVRAIAVPADMIDVDAKGLKLPWELRRVGKGTKYA